MYCSAKTLLAGAGAGSVVASWPRGEHSPRSPHTLRIHPERSCTSPRSPWGYVWRAQTLAGPEDNRPTAPRVIVPASRIVPLVTPHVVAVAVAAGAFQALEASRMTVVIGALERQVVGCR